MYCFSEEDFINGVLDQAKCNYIPTFLVLNIQITSEIKKYVE